MKIAIFTPAPYTKMPSQRFRFEHYLKSLKSNGIEFDFLPFYDTSTWGILYKRGYTMGKVWGLSKNVLKRFAQLFLLPKYDFVFIHREMAPIGPPVFEWIAKYIFQKKIIYDFDDAIWVNQSSAANPGAALVKCAWKVRHICRYSHIVTVGNSFLAKFAEKNCKDVRVIPTVVDTEMVHNELKNQSEKPLTIGWTGTFTNFYNLEIVNEAIRKLQAKYLFEYLIISNKNPEFSGLKYTYIPWNKDTEIADLLRMHIGLMPLHDSEIERGKCAFKAIQYMSLGIPAVVSPVGANCEVVIDNETGLWAQTSEDWFTAIERLIKNEALRAEMGNKSSAFIKNNYSVSSSVSLFLSLFGVKHKNSFK